MARWFSAPFKLPGECLRASGTCPLPWLPVRPLLPYGLPYFVLERELGRDRQAMRVTPSSAARDRRNLVLCAARLIRDFPHKGISEYQPRG